MAYFFKLYRHEAVRGEKKVLEAALGYHDLALWSESRFLGFQ